MGPRSARSPTRRRLLATVAALIGSVSVAGCSALRDGGGNQTGATDVIAHNAATARKTVAVTVTGSEADTPHTSRTLTLAPGETADPVNQSKLPTNASYTVEVSVENGPSETFEWSDPAVERAPLWVLVDDSRNIKFLLQAG